MRRWFKAESWLFKPINFDPLVNPKNAGRGESMKWSSTQFLVFVLVLLVVVIGFVGVSSLSSFKGQSLGQTLSGLLSPVARLVESDCTVGIANSNASITVHGVAPDAYCDQLRTWLGQGRGYVMRSPPAQPVICEYTVSGYRITVRDQGVLKLVGNQACQQLAQLAAKGR